MTTRTFTNDFTHTEVVTDVLTGHTHNSPSVGVYFRKAQAGANQPVGFFAGPLYRGKRRFHRRYQQGLTPHAYSMSLLSYINPMCHLTRAIPLDIIDRAPLELGMGVPPSVFFTANDDLELIGRLHKKIAGNEFNLAVSLAQSGETLDMIASTTLRVAGALRALQKGNIKAAAKHLGLQEGRHNKRNTGQTLTSSWLELRYGWQPLLQDVHDAAQLLAFQLNQPESRSFSARYQRAGSNNGSSPLLWKFRVCRKSVRKQIVAILTEKPSKANLSGFLDPASVAWELLPYSFVFDWFYPVGTYLEERSFFNGLSGNFVTTTTTEIYAEGLFSDSTTAYVVSPEGSAARYHEISVNRTLSTTLKVPKPNIVPFSRAIGWIRAVNALSLINELNLGGKIHR